MPIRGLQTASCICRSTILMAILSGSILSWWWDRCSFPWGTGCSSLWLMLKTVVFQGGRKCPAMCRMPGYSISLDSVHYRGQVVWIYQPIQATSVSLHSLLLLKIPRHSWLSGEKLTESKPNAVFTPSGWTIAGIGSGDLMAQRWCR